LHKNNNIMEAVNTKLFKLNELKYKPYSTLYEFVEGIKEVAMEIEDDIETIEMLEDENGGLDKNMTEQLNYLTTQLDYLVKNLSTGIAALKYCESKNFITMNGFPSISIN